MRAKPFSERTSFCLLMILSLTASWSLVGRRGQEREAEGGGELLELLNGEIFPFQDALVDNSVLLQLHVLKLQSPDLILQLHQLSSVLTGDLVGEFSPATHESESQRERGRVTKEEEGKRRTHRKDSASFSLFRSRFSMFFFIALFFEMALRS
jgi:hypothetical protein